MNLDSPHSDLDGAEQRILSGSFVRSVEIRQQIGSTNDLAMELAPHADLAVPTLVLAAEQTAGRGRGANRWWSGPGALTFSLILEPALAGAFEPHQWPRVALTTGLSVCEFLQKLLPDVPCGLKWPNDVFLFSKKICGILVEVPPARPPLPQRIVLGVGLNVNNSLAEAPEEIACRAISICDATSSRWNRIDVLLGILERLEDNLGALGRNDPALIEKWQALCVLRGRNVEVEFGNRRFSGLCGGIGLDGTLTLDTVEGRRQIAGGIITSIDATGPIARR